MPNVPNDWLVYLNSDSDKAVFKQRLLDNKDLFDMLITIIEAKQKNQKKKVDDYTSPAWAYLQADTNGYVRAYEEIKKLIDFGE